MQDVKFLFIDESFREETKIFSLTGIVVPTLQYPNLRNLFYKIIGPYHYNTNGATIDFTPVELHGKQLLPGRLDEEKLSVCQKVVDLVIENQLEILRIGHYVTKQNTSIFGEQKSLFHLCWLNLLLMAQPYYEDGVLIPIMDGIDPKQTSTNVFPQFVKSLDIARESGIDDANLTLRNSSNLSEVFFVDSKFSVMTQVCDIVSTLRNVTDFERENVALAPFKQLLLPISKRLQSTPMDERIIKFEMLPHP